MKNFSIYAMILVLTACTMTACRFGSSDETAPSSTVPQTTQMQPSTQMIPGSTDNHTTNTTGGGVVEDIIDDVTGKGARRPMR